LGFPFEEYGKRQRATFALPLERRPLIALTWTSECIDLGHLVPYWLSTPAMGFGRPSRCLVVERLHRCDTNQDPLMPLARVQSRIDTSCSREHPSMGFRPLRRLLDTDSDIRRAYLSRLRSAFRFSQPLDALLRPRPHGPVSCRIRPWGSDLQRLPPPTGRHDFRRALPLLPFVAPKRVRLQGFLPAGGPFTSGRCYPGPDGRSSPGCSTLSRWSPRVSASHRCKASSHGLFTTLDRSIVVTALQSVKELKG
jgi:hypothetical protein